MFNVVIKNGLVIDGTGNPWFKAYVGIQDGRIVEVGRYTGSGERVIDAKGLIVAPGFIDLHNHSDATILVHNRAENLVRQGITTVATGNCGSSTAPITEAYRERLRRRMVRLGVEVDWLTMAEWMERVRRQVGINIAPFCGFGTIRSCIMGIEGEGSERYEPTEEELQEMKAMVRQALEDGAFGLTTGLEYPPQRNAYTEEIIALCRVVAGFGGLYMSHIRSEDERLIEAVKEHIEICERTGVPGCISHHKACLPNSWGKPCETVRLIRRARTRGIEIICDVYPWRAAAISNVGRHFISRESPLNKEELLERFKDPVEWEKIKGAAKKRIEAEKRRNEERRRALAERGVPCTIVWDPTTYPVIVYSKRRPDILWKNFTEAAKIMGEADSWEAMRSLYIADEGETKNAFGFMCEEDIITLYRAPWTAVSTDASAEDEPRALHPRGYGSFPRFIKRYVHELKVLTLEEAVRRMTALPAQFLRLQDRGLIREGFWADIVVFDPKRVRSRATYIEPCRSPEGIPYVLVNGRIVVDKEKHTGALSGKVLTHAK